MALNLKTLNPAMFVRRCVVCGYDGSLLNGPYVERCPRCGCDLRVRPPRSYAEMEGFLGPPVALEPRNNPVLSQERLIQRWLAFLFMVLLGLVVLAYLTAQAIP